LPEIHARRDKLLRVHAFGQLRLDCRQMTLAHFPTRQVKELLGFLLLHPRRPYMREEVVTLLWPERSLEKARHSLSMVLWRLRNVFRQIELPAEQFIASNREWVSFCPERPYRFDRDLFEQNYRQARNTDDPGQQEESLRCALNLYRGELYPGIYSDWCLVERERLALMHLQTVAWLMEHCMRRQSYEEAVELGQRILAEDPLREGVHRKLMQCYFQMGRATRAVQQFTVCAEIIQDILNCPPQPETIALYAEITAARFNTARQTTRSDHYQNQLQAAFAAFQESGRCLNQLLDADNSTII
jgi:DNA-binding SARP family transcriptional activator